MNQSPLATRRAILAGTAGLAAPAAAFAAISNQQVLSEIGGSLNRTAAEIAASVTPVNYAYAELNVLRYGADPTGTNDSTTAIQNALNVAQKSHNTVVIPAGIYLVSSLSIVSTNGLRIQGCSTSAYTNIYGSVLKHTGTGTLFAVDGNGAQANVLIDGVTFLGNSNSQVGLKFTRATFITLQNCPFLYFNMSDAAALYFTYPAIGDFTGVVKVIDCVFLFNYKAVHADQPAFNAYFFTFSNFSANTFGVYVGVTGSTFQSAKVSISRCLFEGNTQRDIYSAGGMESLVIDDNYFEQPSAGKACPMIYLDGNVNSPVNSSVSICRNYFAQQLGGAGQSVIYIDAAIYGLTVKNNFSAYGGADDRFFLANINNSFQGSQYWDIEVPNCVSGTNGYPNQINGTSVSLRNVYPTAIFHAKAWITFDGTTSGGGILDSFNVASFSRSATGTYLITFDNAMNSNGYVAVGTASSYFLSQGATKTTTQCEILVRDGSGTTQDANPVDVLFFSR